jgi:hypothetical protein
MPIMDKTRIIKKINFFNSVALCERSVILCVTKKELTRSYTE